MGKLIVIEGLDGCGKSTQISLLPESLGAKGINSKVISFPDYDDPSSTLVKMYLNGDFGTSPDSVNAYAASLFYAVDRYASFKRHWSDYYTAGGTVISGRYVESNAYHQMSKLPENEWDNYLDWLYETEYSRTAIPKPDLVIFLDMPTEVSEKMLRVRYGGDDTKKDIHERDKEYLDRCRSAAKYAAEKCGWSVIRCDENGEPRSVDAIQKDILEFVLKAIK